MEQKFPFHTDEVKIPFFWFESLFKDRQVQTTCIQYEKAGVLYNMACVYSQLGARERKWTQDGKKKAALYLQKAAGIFLHIRDVLCPQFKIKLSKTSDLSEQTLTASATLMLAQAAECFYEKANDGGTSSSVTALVSVYCSDLYDVAARQSEVGNKLRFPQSWVDYCKSKSYLFGAIAHFHTGPISSSDRVVAERLARLQVAMTMVQKSRNLSQGLGGILDELVLKYVDCIGNALLCLDEANHDLIHDTPYDPRLLTPLKRPPQALVNPQPLEDIQVTGDTLKAVVAPTQFMSIQKVLLESVEMSAEYQSTLSRLNDTVKSKIQALQLNVGKLSASQASVDIKDKATQLVSQIQKYQQEETVISSLLIVKCLERINKYFDEDVDLAATILDPIRHVKLDAPFNEPLMTNIHRDLKSRLDFQSKYQQQIEKRYYEEVVPFSPMSWTLEKLTAILPIISVAPEQIHKICADQAMEIQKLETEIQNMSDTLAKLEEQNKPVLQRLRELHADAWTKEHGLNYKQAVEERTVFLKQVETECKHIVSQWEAAVAGLDALLQSSEKQKTQLQENQTQGEIVSNFLNGIQVCTSYRDLLSENVQVFLVFREVSARFVASCLKVDFDGVYDRYPRDPIISKVRNIDIKWKELDMPTLEKRFKSMSADELNKLLYDACILPMDDSPNFVKHLQKKVSSFFIDEEIRPRKPAQAPSRYESVDQIELEPSEPVKEDRYVSFQNLPEHKESSLSKFVQSFKDGLSRLLPSRTPVKPHTIARVSSQKLDNPFTEPGSRKSSHASALEMNELVEKEEHTEQDYVDAIMKENSRLRAMVLKVKEEAKHQQRTVDKPRDIKDQEPRPRVGREKMQGNTKLHEWLTEQRKLSASKLKVSQGSESEEISLEDADPQTASLAAAVAVGVRAAQRVVFAQRKRERKREDGPLVMMIKPETENPYAQKSKFDFTREDSAIVTTPRQMSREDMQDIQARHLASKAHLFANIKLDNDSIAKEIGSRRHQ
ncbi:BRO1-like domain-containing protein [Gorgonomyces haynaldii]|nr:BRO1-like domain-containing protein [Gorgonomyces haynaldii]